MADQILKASPSGPEPAARRIDRASMANSLRNAAPQPQGRVLCVDDEPRVLEGLTLHLRRRFEVATAGSGPAGLERLSQQGPFAIVVSDLRMPEMDGAAFLAQVKRLAPDTVRLLLTGHADLDAAIAAVNQGQIFRFLTKPCSPETLLEACGAAAEQYRLITAERELLEKTLRGTVNVLTDLLSQLNPLAFRRASRLQRLVRQLLPRFGETNAWQLDVTAMLSQIGLVTMPATILEKIDQGLDLSAEEAEMLDRHPQLGHDIIARIPRLEAVAESIALQRRRFDGLQPLGDARQGRDLPLGARILKLVGDYDSLVSPGGSSGAALAEMRSRKGHYDPLLLAALEETIRNTEASCVERLVHLKDLTTGMILSQPVKTRKGLLLIDKGQEISFAVLLKIWNFARFEDLGEPLRVLVPAEPDAERDGAPLLPAEHG